jgi:phage-related protein
MPPVEVVFYAMEDGTVPLLDWLDGLPRKVQNKCIVRIERLAEFGWELRRPEADLLRDGVCELRVRHGHVNYRVVYFFDRGRAVISHGLAKERRVPDRDIDLALRRRQEVEHDPERHVHRSPDGGG